MYNKTSLEIGTPINTSGASLIANKKHFEAPIDLIATNTGDTIESEVYGTLRVDLFNIPLSEIQTLETL